MGNRYYPHNGKELASVTTITSCLDKSSALMQWAANCAVDWIKHEAIPGAKLGRDWFYVDSGVLESARTEWRTVRDNAGDIGTQVHDALEFYLMDYQANGHGETPIEHMPEQAQKLFKGAVTQLKKLGNFKVLATEQKVVNEAEWYAGRFDALLEVDGETWLIDFKTGASFYPEWGMQLAAYAEALGLRIDRIKILRLDKGTLKAHWKEYGGEKDTLDRQLYMQAFYGLRDAFYLMKAKKAAKLAFMEDYYG